MLPKGFYAFHPLHDTESHQIAVLFTLPNRESPDHKLDNCVDTLGNLRLGK